MVPLIILLDGETGSVDEQFVTLTYLQETFKQLNGEDALIPPGALVVEDSSFNTATNIEALARIANGRNIKRVLIVTNDFHRARATLLACANGLAATSGSAETIVLQQNPERRAEINLIREEGYRQNGKEIPEIISQLWSPKGELQVFFWEMRN